MAPVGFGDFVADVLAHELQFGRQTDTQVDVAHNGRGMGIFPAEDTLFVQAVTNICTMCRGKEDFGLVTVSLLDLGHPIPTVPELTAV